MSALATIRCVAGLVAVVLASFAVSVGMAGCGSSDNGATTRLTRAQLTKRADNICNRGRREALSSSAKDPIQEAVLPALERAAERLQELSSSDRAGRLEQIADALERDVEAARRAGVRDLPQLEDRLKRSARLARKLGVAACAFA